MSVFGYQQEDIPGIQPQSTQPPDNFLYVIPIDYLLHTPEKPFCPFDFPCHEDESLIAAVAVFVQDGLMTPEEATDFVRGRGI